MESPFCHGRSWMKDFLALILEGAPSATFSTTTTTVDGAVHRLYVPYYIRYLCKSASFLEHARCGYEKNGSHLRTHVPRTAGRFVWNAPVILTLVRLSVSQMLWTNAINQLEKILSPNCVAYYSAQNRRKTKLKFLTTSRSLV